MHQRRNSHPFFQSIFAIVFIFFYSCAEENKSANENRSQTSQENQAETKPAEQTSSVGSITPENTLSDQLQHETTQKTEKNKLQDQSIANSDKQKKKDVVVIEEIPPSTVDLTKESNNQEMSMVDAGPPPPPQEIGEDAIYDFVSEMPVFPGGEEARLLYIQKNTIYPEPERLNGIQGKVYVSFVVEKDGSISNVVLLRGISGGPGLNKEAMRVVKSFPKFSPGKLDGKIVRTRMNLPVHFKLS